MDKASQSYGQRKTTHVNSNPLVAEPSNWESMTKRTHNLKFTPGPSPTLPDLPPSKSHNRAHNPHSKNVYHIRRFNNERVCDVTSSENGEQDRTFNSQSISRTTYGPKPLGSERRFTKSLYTSKDPHPLVNTIVPIDHQIDETRANFAKCERILPADAKVHMLNTKPFVTLKRRVTPPTEEGGVFYHDVPRLNKESVTLLSGGQSFSRRKASKGPAETLCVNGFDGGPQGEAWPTRHSFYKNAFHRSDNRKSQLPDVRDNQYTIN
ncbi:unnamed protein product [Owenia fusiformis]|uniref:Uncharacterized protein n=1 Tax=Owenia fusiformis TaxID=6347 RepID=A0A8J1TU90_OWEFU|nr:unnamed protein product [Owenia fusiformis]